MIFTRLSRALIEQNWLTVVLEILVVVIGLFVGLQVDDWNEDRKNRNQELVCLTKPSDDLRAMRVDLQEQMEKRTERVERMKSALSALENCDVSPRAQADVKFALERYQVSNGINFLDATYNEMVASGALARIADQELKQRIAYAFSALGSVNENARLTAGFDIPEICENVELRNAFAEMVAIQRDGIGVGVDILPIVDDLSVRLTAATSCARATSVSATCVP